MKINDAELAEELSNEDIVTLHLPIGQFFDLVKEHRLHPLWWDTENVYGGDMTEVEDQDIPYEKRNIYMEINFEGEFYKLLPDGSCDETNPHSEFCQGEEVFTIPLDKNKPSLFQRSYQDMDEIVEEIRGKLDKFVELPDDFPYDEVIGLLSGTTWQSD